MLKVKENDRARILRGKDRGKTGKVLRIEPTKNFVFVEGVNIIKIHTRQKKQGQPGGIISKEGPVHISNVAVVCPNCNKASRMGFELKDSGEKIRVCKKCGGQF
ncbi:MAG: 50S ribosomal protein L24 [Actinobacteria bacterium]|nr:50S ribosomal protein L24 [Actinomycetota bacterium]MBM3712401.1 50S ribosomal protein L24 [Actinomycetota bacterium]